MLPGLEDNGRSLQNVCFIREVHNKLRKEIICTFIYISIIYLNNISIEIKGVAKFAISTKCKFSIKINDICHFAAVAAIVTLF